jgi:hypothetical protein
LPLALRSRWRKRKATRSVFFENVGVASRAEKTLRERREAYRQVVVSKIQNFLGYMSQSSIRNNFSDILLDPTTIAVVGSIAIHAIFAANLAFFTQPSKELKKPDPGTVKVVELTPNELQRIPQAPKPVATPTPSQQVLPPVYQPSTPAPPVNQPIDPPIATEPTTIPLTPIPVTPPPKQKVAAKSPVIRIPPKQKVVTKPPKGPKDQKAIPQVQPAPPAFDPDNFQTTPEPTPTPTPEKPKVATKPSPPPSQPPKKKTTATKKRQKTQREIDGEEQDDRKPSKPADSDETGLIIPVPSPGTKTAATPKVSPSPQPTEQPPGDGDNGSFAGKYASQVSTKLQEYIKKYPGIKIYPVPLKPIVKPYPPGVACSKVKQSPFVVLLVPFSKVADGKDSNVLGASSSEPLEVSTFGNDNEELSILAKKFATEAANEAEKTRPPADKDKQVLYQNRVQFDPATCKK